MGSSSLLEFSISLTFEHSVCSEPSVLTFTWPVGLFWRVLEYLVWTARTDLSLFFKLWVLSTYSNSNFLRILNLLLKATFCFRSLYFMGFIYPLHFSFFYSQLLVDIFLNLVSFSLWFGNWDKHLCPSLPTTAVPGQFSGVILLSIWVLQNGDHQLLVTRYFSLPFQETKLPTRLYYGPCSSTILRTRLLRLLFLIVYPAPCY